MSFKKNVWNNVIKILSQVPSKKQMKFYCLVLLAGCWFDYVVRPFHFMCNLNKIEQLNFNCSFYTTPILKGKRNSVR